jgi:hypothetical protein
MNVMCRAVNINTFSDKAKTNLIFNLIQTRKELQWQRGIDTHIPTFHITKMQLPYN